MAMRYRRSVRGSVHVHPNAQTMKVVRTTPTAKMTKMVIKDASEFHVADIAADVWLLYSSEEEGDKVLKPPWLRALHGLIKPTLSEAVLNEFVA